MQEFRLFDPEWMESADLWMDFSKCGNDRAYQDWQREHREDQFFDEKAQPGPGNHQMELRSRVQRAKAYCKDCPVKQDCLNHALKFDEVGIWGGLTERERHSLQNRTRKAAVKWIEQMLGVSLGEHDPNAA